MRAGALATMVFALLIGFPFASMAGLAADDDSDGVPNVLDNCLNVKNAGVGLNGNCDTDSDGYGNMCDCDINNSQPLCDGTDLAFWKVAFKASPQTNFRADHNCSGVIDGTDLAIWKVRFKSASQQNSGLSCAGTIPCNP